MSVRNTPGHPQAAISSAKVDDQTRAPLKLQLVPQQAPASNSVCVHNRAPRLAQTASASEKFAAAVQSGCVEQSAEAVEQHPTAATLRGDNGCGVDAALAAQTKTATWNSSAYDVLPAPEGGATVVLVVVDVVLVVDVLVSVLRGWRHNCKSQCKQHALISPPPVLQSHATTSKPCCPTPRVQNCGVAGKHTNPPLSRPSETRSTNSEEHHPASGLRHDAEDPKLGEERPHALRSPHEKASTPRLQTRHTTRARSGPISDRAPRPSLRAAPSP